MDAYKIEGLVYSANINLLFPISKEAVLEARDKLIEAKEEIEKGLADIDEYLNGD